MATPDGRRPTLLVGCGDFGRDVLRHVLNTTASRSATRQVGSNVSKLPEGQRLEGLAFLWMPDAVVEGQVDEATDRDVMWDLYRQIERVDVEECGDTALAEAMERTAARLLDPASRSRSSASLPLGLDVIVVARPARREALGRLNAQLLGGIQRLANSPNLSISTQGAEVLNCIQILDFDNYWDELRDGPLLREAVYDAAEEWHALRRHRQSSVGRIYLVDGRTRDGHRGARTRIEETTLFLELLLFEGQRGTLQWLFQPSDLDEAPLGSFGIRMMERSSDRLVRLAAARFGIEWLEYLRSGTTSDPDDHARALREELRRSREAQDRILESSDSLSHFERRVRELESELLALSPEAEDWPEQIRERYESSSGEIRRELVRRSESEISRLRTELIDGLPVRLQEAIDADLSGTRPVSLRRVEQELDAALSKVCVEKRAASPPTLPDSDTHPLGDIDALHRKYREFRAERIDPVRLGLLWPWLASLFAAALTPVATAAARLAPDMSEAGTWFGWLSRLASPFASPPLCGAILFAVGWYVGSLAQRRVAGRMRRASAFFTHPERGRLADRIRAELAPGGQLRAPLEEHLGTLLFDTQNLAAEEVSGELAHVRRLLARRGAEIGWLRDQLLEFQRRFDVSGPGGAAPADAIRLHVASAEDVDRILETNPINHARFSSTQTDLRPLEGWHQEFCTTFLTPLVFIDRLSGSYQDPRQAEFSRPGDGPEQARRRSEVVDFLRRYGSFDMGFSWSEGQPARRLCICPGSWRRDVDVLNTLSSVSFTEDSILEARDASRAYLVATRVGVPTASLLRNRA